MCFAEIRSERISTCTWSQIAVSEVDGGSGAALWCFSVAVDLAVAVEVAVAVWAGGAQQGAVERSGT